MSLPACCESRGAEEEDKEGGETDRLIRSCMQDADQDARLPGRVCEVQKYGEYHGCGTSAWCASAARTL